MLKLRATSIDGGKRTKLNENPNLKPSCHPPDNHTIK